MTSCRRRSHGSAAVLSLLTIIAVLCFTGSAAMAMQTNQYDEFWACPTDAPLLNDPQYEFAVCGSGVVEGGSFTIGSLTVPLDSPIHAQFGAVAPNPALEDCSPLTCLPVAPGRTTVEAEPIPIVLPTPATYPGLEGPGGGRRPDGINQPRVGNFPPPERTTPGTLSIELAGDIHGIALEAIFGQPVPAYELPIKLHLRGRFLGRNCYIGSNENPVVLAPVQTTPPTSGEFLGDPNGFQIEMLKIIGAAGEDSTFAVPAAHGCGPKVRDGSEPIHVRDRLINRFFDLPSPSGNNRVEFVGSNLAFAVATYNGTPPEGGAELQAAFEAAQ